MVHVPPEELVRKYASKGLLVDTNVLLIYLAGLLDRQMLEGLPRNTKGYTAEDHAILEALIEQFHRVVTTPHVLAELSNLTDHFRFKRPEARLGDRLQQVVDFLRQAREEHTPKRTILSDTWKATLLRFGVTDVSIMAAAQAERYLVLTDDLALIGSLAKRGLDALNFTDLRFRT